MLKWAVTLRANNDIDEQDIIENGDNYGFLTLPAIIERYELPCLVRVINDDASYSVDSYCLLLCETEDPYLIVSNETERCAVPLSFDGLFAPVERGVTHYNTFPSIRSLQSRLKSSSSQLPSSTVDASHFTTLQACTAISNNAPHLIQPGTLLEACYKPISSMRPTTPSPSSPSSSNRLRSLFAHIPRSLNKHLLANHQHTRPMKVNLSSNDYCEVKTDRGDEVFALKLDLPGIFVPVCTQLPTVNSRNQSSSNTSDNIQGVYTTSLLSKLTDQYPLIMELMISRTLQENIPTKVEYPIKRITLHRLIEKHRRIIAFDMKNYAFIEIDAKDPTSMNVITQDDTLFQRYQAQVRWCHKHLSAFRSQIKTIVHALSGAAMLVQATPFQGQQLQQYHQRRNSSSLMSTPLAKHQPQTLFTSQESIAMGRLRPRTPTPLRFHTASNTMKFIEKQAHKGKTIGSSGTTRKDVRMYFNDPFIQKHLHNELWMSKKKFSSYGVNSKSSNNIDVGNDIDTSFQCTAL